MSKVQVEIPDEAEVSIKGKTNGLKSTEFWLTVVSLIGGALVAIFVPGWTAVAVGVGGGILAVMGYQNGRSQIKKGIALGEGIRKELPKK